MISPPRIYSISVTVPAGTPIGAPVSVPWVTEDNTISDIELEIPPGHNGLTGIRITKGDIQLVPWSKNQWIVANDYSRVFPVGVYIPTGDLKINAYNTGSYPHTFYLRMTVTDFDPNAGQSEGNPSQALPAQDVITAPDPLSPDAILGPDTAAGLADGTLTADQVAPVDATDLTLPPQPEPDQALA